MKRIYLFTIAAAALTFAACSSDDGLTNEQQTAQIADDGAIAFDAYLNRGTTRAGYKGELKSTAAVDAFETEGFGVFGYYTNNQPYNETAIPGFMYNEKVTSDGSTWTYAPVKYWPNEFGDNAMSEGQDKLTFFAYAPYVEVTPGTGRIASSEKSGIVGLTSNVTTGDPYVKYYVDFDPENRVDLCWGVSKEGLNSSVDDTGSPNAIAAGAPYIDVVKPKIGDKINFNFLHALAAINVTIDADIDQVSHGDADYKDKFTKIWVRSVTFEGFTDKGSLNLDAKVDEGPLWYELSSTNTRIGGTGSVTIYDGRRDGKEGQENAAATNENPRSLNAQIIQSEPYVNTDAELVTNANLVTAHGLSGVPATAAINLFDSDDASAPIYVIPTGTPLKVTIVYDVETYDPSLSKYLADGVLKGSTIENAITKDITLSSSALTLEAGKLYTIALHLGMTSVKFEATVNGWETATPAPDNIDLPINAPASFSATAPAAQSAAAYDDFAVTVKDASNADVDMSTPGDFTFVTTYSDNNGNNNVAIDLSATGTSTGFTVDLPALTDFYGRVYKVVVTKTATGEKQVVEITQNAPVLNETITAGYTTGTKTIALTPTTLTMTPTISTPWSWSNITVTDSGDNLVSATNNEDGSLVTDDVLSSGDYTITIINGDVTTVVSLNVP